MKQNKVWKWIDDNFTSRVGRFRAGAHITPKDSYTSLCGHETINRTPNRRLDRKCKKCKDAVLALARDHFDDEQEATA